MGALVYKDKSGLKYLSQRYIHCRPSETHQAVLTPEALQYATLFGPSGMAIEALFNTMNGSDFALFVFSPDYKVDNRDNEYNTQRDNTVFEMGLYMGEMERGRTFIVKEQSADVKVPTDLLGITSLTYVYRRGGIFSRCYFARLHELRKVIKSLVVR